MSTTHAILPDVARLQVAQRLRDADDAHRRRLARRTAPPTSVAGADALALTSTRATYSGRTTMDLSNREKGPLMTLPMNAALVVVDAQTAFDDPWWGPRNNPSCDANISSLVSAFASTGRPVVYVRHESRNPDSPLHPKQPGNALKPYLDAHTPDLVVTKEVNSSFHGFPDLDSWLREHDISTIVIAGITTNHCCETTARVGGNLGYDVRFALDATHTFDRVGPDGVTMTADELARATATNLHGEFAAVVSTRDVQAATAGNTVPQS